ncbi:MAG: High-affinity branched-chain amino acid transport system permease protein LivH [Alphaproteobacteria bacterium MarineAlpha9_Bin5]|nr:MAG: High-affinity branched-chain amino acid transport system permease protein LivH [Alphaproteobacteria bacterium MarineAlpha9_Bin5]HIA20918.1 branched-chain amino acid ABC transporter permease [Alphaproteobacteria bacterium]HIB18318.1 branched-chain amino acid ABC transporter permease [Alphaproteobacteria bacterium]HIB57231.1 branched-chain amino acid ABC transporter permease [Alphaproteobacteria bacterium]HIO03232.1 branched-chain amino acid ABC transporter permease [Alphaproteobacteria b
MFEHQLFVNAVLSGLLLGGFYASVSVGLTLAFGHLNIVNIAHPAFVILGSYTAYITNLLLGLDPIASGVLFMPVFFAGGIILYRIYHVCFEARGDESLRGLVFFFGIMFVIEVGLIIAYGVDYRFVEAAYIGGTVGYGAINLPLRMVAPFMAALALTLGLQLFLSRTFTGRAIMAVSQDQIAVRLMGINPIRIKQIAFGLAIMTASLAGALLIVIGPVEPSMGRQYIGRVFAIAVLGGMGSVPGTLVAALILGIAESLTATFYGPSWAPAVAFGLLLGALAIRPQGLFGR